MSLKVRSDLRVEAVGEDLMVLDAADGQVHSLSGGLAEALRLVVAGTAPSDIPSHLDDALASLIDKGIVENGGWSRRKMLATGGVGAAAFGGTLISMQLPAAAAASSCPGADQGDDLATPITYNTPGSTSFKTGGMVTMVTVTAWGGGGGGGDDNGSNSRGGGGGGGGGFITTTVTVTPCTVYTVTVGDRGVTGKDTPGTDGTASSFTDFGINITAGGGKGGGWYPFLGMAGDNDGGGLTAYGAVVRPEPPPAAPRVEPLRGLVARVETEGAPLLTPEAVAAAADRQARGQRVALAALTTREEVRLAQLARVRPLGLLAPSAATTTGRPPATPAHRGRPAAAAAAVAPTAGAAATLPPPVLLAGSSSPTLRSRFQPQSGCLA